MTERLENDCSNPLNNEASQVPNNKRAHDEITSDSPNIDEDNYSESESETEPKESSSKSLTYEQMSPASSAYSPQASNGQQSTDLMQMMQMIRQQQSLKDEPLIRTSSNSSTASSASTCSSITSANDLNSKQFMLSIANGSTEDPSKKAFAGQFAHLVDRSRSSSISEASSTASSNSEMLQNPGSNNLMKQMINSYQATVQSNVKQLAQPCSPQANRKGSTSSSVASEMGQTSSLFNNCNLDSTPTKSVNNQRQSQIKSN